MFKLGLEKAEEPEIILPASIGTFKKQESSRKIFISALFFFFFYSAKAFDCVNHNKLWKILQETGIPDHHTFHLRNLCVDQEARIRHGTTDWLQIGKGVCQDCVLSPCLFNLYVETLGWMKHKLESRLPEET